MERVRVFSFAGIAMMMLAGISWFPGPAAAEGEPVKILKNIPYQGSGSNLKLDLYLPESAAAAKDGKPRPAILIVHGGGWTGGDKGAARERNIGTTLAGAGYVCASVNYRLAKKKERLAERLRQVWPKNLQDCMTAVRFLRANAQKYHIDPEKIGAIGGSAGGHLVAMLATAGDDDGFDPEGPHAECSCRIQAAVPLYGVHDVEAQAKARGSDDQLTADDRDLCRRASPVTYLSKDDPPLLILHGTKDHLVPVAQSEILHEAAEKSGIESELHIIEGAAHSFHLQPKQRDLRPLVIDFFNRHLGTEK